MHNQPLAPHLSSHRRFGALHQVKLAAVLLIGLPTTIVFGATAALGAFVGVVMLVSMGVEVARGTVPHHLAASAVLALWGPAGLAGIAGFWSWVCLPAAPTRRRLLLSAVGLTLGVLALEPITPAASFSLTTSAILGSYAVFVCTAATLIALSLLLHLTRPRAGAAAARNATIVLFDGACPLCRTEMQRLKLRDPDHRLRLVDIAAPEFNAPAWGFELAALGDALHARAPDGRWLIGMAAIRHVYARVGLGWLLAPTGWPVLRPAFDRFYARLARHRVPVSGRLLALGYGRCDAGCAAAPRAWS